MASNHTVNMFTIIQKQTLYYGSPLLIFTQVVDSYVSLLPKAFVQSFDHLSEGQ
jgi:hypothetical protein